MPQVTTFPLTPPKSGTSNPKLFLHNHCYFISSRCLEGLPFICRAFMNLILKSILARSLKLFDITLCDFIFMQNHFHLLLVINNPEHADAFIGHLKTETAHAINKMRGKKAGNFWQDCYDSPVILDLEKLKEQIVYLYTNPQKAGLVDDIAEYPGCSSWSMRCSEQQHQTVLHLPRRAMHKLAQGVLSRAQERHYIKRLQDYAYSDTERLSIDPRAAFEAVVALSGNPGNISYQQFFEQCQQEIQQRQLELARQRVDDNKKAIGARGLAKQSFFKAYIPKKHGSKRMLCLSKHKHLRQRYIALYKALKELARKGYRRLKAGDYSREALEDFPPGLYLPGRVRIANIIPQVFWTGGFIPT
ncbi:MAG: transposase [Bacteroidota bacterium]